LASFPELPTAFFVIDETNWDEYAYLSVGDQCFYLWERMSSLWEEGRRPDYGKYPTNQFISNFQIPMSCKTENPMRFRHKGPAVKFAADALSALLPNEWREQGVFVPIPPSKIKTHPEYDPRLLATLTAVKPALPDVRELILQRETADSKQKGIRPEERADNYFIDETEADSTPDLIFVFDDVLTTGGHFKAAQMVLSERFSRATICGIFLARAVRPNRDNDEDLWDTLARNG
jgi:hypothetical protein